jgi:hypothetical protein
MLPKFIGANCFTHYVCVAISAQAASSLARMVSKKNATVGSCLSRLDVSIGKVADLLPRSCFTGPFELRLLHATGRARELRGRPIGLESANYPMAMCSICWLRKSEARAPNVSQEHQIDSARTNCCAKQNCCQKVTSHLTKRVALDRPESVKFGHELLHKQCQEQCEITVYYLATCDRANPPLARSVVKVAAIYGGGYPFVAR